jgi:hypothetical protein
MAPPGLFRGQSNSEIIPHRRHSQKFLPVLLEKIFYRYQKFIGNPGESGDPAFSKIF